jgi:hypothetical protein
MKNKLMKITATALLFVCCVIFTACGKGGTEIGDRIDLTTMNSNIVYSYVNEMVNNNPKKYVGKTIVAAGQYDKTTVGGNTYNFVVIADALACCAQGIEFEYSGSLPDINAKIKIEGVYESYNEGKRTYYHIVVTEFTRQ